MSQENKMIMSIIKMSYEEQNQRLRFFAKVDITVRLKILRYQKSQFHKLKSQYASVGNELLTLASLILAIEQATGELNDLEINVAKTRAKITRKKNKRDKLLSLWAIIRSLKLEEKMSFRDISKYLLKYHKLSVVHSTIFEMWTELEQNTPLK